MDKRNSDLVLRLSIAIGFGLLIAFSTYLLAFYRQRLAFGFAQNPEVFGSAVVHEIEKYRSTVGHLPAKLSDVVRWALDPWNRPYFYEVEGNSYKLYSYGRDGVPGGDGLDADYYAGQRVRLATLRQFTFDLKTRRPQLICSAAGICAGIVCGLVWKTRRRVLFLALSAALAFGLTNFLINKLLGTSNHILEQF